MIRLLMKFKTSPCLNFAILRDIRMKKYINKLEVKNIFDWKKYFLINKFKLFRLFKKKQ